MLRRIGTYASAFEASLKSPEAFWTEQAGSIAWDKSFEKALDFKSPFCKWFPGGRLNMSYNCLDRHILDGRGDQWAFIFDSPMKSRIVHYTYHQTLNEVKRIAGLLTFHAGVRPGDRVIIYMPLVPEAIFAMLACARIGAVHSVVFAGFAAKELASRIVDAGANVILTSDYAQEPNRVIPLKPLVDQALAMTNFKGKVYVHQRGGHNVPCQMQRGRDYDMHEILDNTKTEEAVVSVESSHPLYILYTSGTTGSPKGVLRDTGGYAVGLQYAMNYVYGLNPSETFCSLSDIGWVVGHSLMVYGPLLRGCTSVIYEGKPVGTPDASSWWRLVHQHQVNVMFFAPTGVRAIKREDPQAHLIKPFDLSSLKQVTLAGERCEPDTIHWLTKHLPKSVLINDHWWQTESGWAMISNFGNLSQFPVKPGSATKPVPGWNMQILKDDGNEAAPNEHGSVVVKLPTPPGFMLTLYKNDSSFEEKYMKAFPGYYLAGDEGFIDDDGYFHIMGRIDDVINTAGHRLSTYAIEEVLNSHPAIAEAACFGVKDEIKGEVPIAVVALKPNMEETLEELVHQLIHKVRDEIGPVASFKSVVVVQSLPKTKSGKILRKTLRQIAAGENYAYPATIDNPESLKEVELALREHGFSKK